MSLASDSSSTPKPPARASSSRPCRAGRRHRLRRARRELPGGAGRLHDATDRIRFIACRHEGGAAFMAEAHGKLTGRPGVCFVTRGPGATNASIGVHAAFQDSTPMVLLHRPGRAPTSATARRSRRSTTARCSAPARWAWRSGSARCTIRRACPNTWRARSTPRCRAGPGPVVLALPEDMLSRADDRAAVLARVEPAQACAGARTRSSSSASC